MRLDHHSIKPIYIQIAEAIEEEILAGRLHEGEPCYSQYTLAKELGINPATAAKGINLLVQQAILEKQRGQAMLVKVGAVELLRKKGKQLALDEAIGNLVKEAKKWNLTERELKERLNEYLTLHDVQLKGE